MRGIGLDKWPGVLRDAAGRAEAYRPGHEGTMLADATPPNRATDASAATASPVRYVADNPRQWIGRPSVGSGECVPLVQQATGAPRSSQWRQGPQVQGNSTILPGTAIATFDANGHYAGHAAIYLGPDAGGIQVVDQWNRRDRAGTITDRQIPNDRTLRFNSPTHSLVDRGEFYHVVE